jgi:hypothetical protein
MLESPQASATKNTAAPEALDHVERGTGARPEAGDNEAIAIGCFDGLHKIGVSQALMDVRSTTSSAGKIPPVTSGTNGSAKVSAVTVDRTVGTLKSFALRRKNDGRFLALELTFVSG